MSRGPNQPDAPALHSICNSLKHNTIIHCPSIFDQNIPEWVDMAHYAVGAVKLRPLRSRRGRVGFRPAAAIRVALPGGGRSGDSWRASPPGRFRLRTAFERARRRPQTKTAARILWQLSPLRGASRIRTGDPLLAKQVLYQLSYNPGGCSWPLGEGRRNKKSRAGVRLVGPGRVELPTSTLSV